MTCWASSIKVAIAAEARSLEEMGKSVTKDAIYEQPWIGEELVPAIAADRGRCWPAPHSGDGSHLPARLGITLARGLAASLRRA
jgi:hypothetical protein